MTTPRATVRLQLNADFTLDDAREQLAYFADLGVSHLYLSPVFCATPGSTHGYDVVDFQQVNPEIGGPQALQRLSDAAHAKGLGLVIDIVPNHMATHAMANAWWRDVLQHGRDSAFAKTFDIDWASPAHDGKILLPILGEPLGQVLKNGELRVRRDEDSDQLVLAYHDYHLPLSTASQQRLHDEAGAGGLDALLADYAPRLAVGAAGSAPLQTGDGDTSVSDASLVDPEELGFNPRLLDLLDEQNYRLAWWRTAADELNWRRFFEVSDLIGLRIERPEVFEAVHALTFSLYEQGIIDGVRVDHVDGLADPAAYCRQLRERLDALQAKRPADRRAGRPWIVIEKILAFDEPLADDWQVDGTTGYDFMNDVLKVLHDPAGIGPLNVLWERTSGQPADFDAAQREARRQLLNENLVSEFQALKRRLHELAQFDPISRDISAPMIERALGALLEHFPVYRLYVTQAGQASAQDAATFARAYDGARATLRSADLMALPWLRRWLGLRPPSWPLPSDGASALANERAELREKRQRATIVKFQQLTTSLAAKAVEDTAFYRFHRLLSLNEVGGDPDIFCVDVATFHQRMHDAGQATPHRLLATATHDHKRGEDVRARLAVISEVAPAWAEALPQWRHDAWTQAQVGQPGLAETARPSAIDELAVIQMIVGAWPMALAPDDDAGMRAYFERLAAWQGKALREAKHHTDWAAPDEQYEQLCKDYLFGLLTPPPLGIPVIGRIHQFAQSLMAAGAVNGLAQTLLRMTVPGVPDLYQGTEFWDFSLVDPDNRRPVDYPMARRTLAEHAPLSELIANWRDGRIKQRLVQSTLRCRADWPSLFAEGAYVPIAVTGRLADRIVAFARDDGDQVALVVIARWVWPLLDGPQPVIAAATWADTALTLPPALQRLRWTDVIDDRTQVMDEQVRVGELLQPLPLTLWIASRTGTDGDAGLESAEAGNG